MTAFAKAGLRPYREFVELGEWYCYFTKSLIDAAPGKRCVPQEASQGTQ